MAEPYIIGEAGTCHAHIERRERLRLAYAHVMCAAEAGADAVKFQMFASPIRDDMFCWIEGDERRAGRWLNSVLELEEWRDVIALAQERGIAFLASVFQDRTVDWIPALGLRATKVASRASANFPYERAAGDIFISTGMPPYPENIGTLLECESVYPSHRPWAGRYPGFSAHSPTPDLAIDALRRGCKLVEVHFYTDPAHAGPDLPASLDLDGLRAVCASRERKAA